MAVNNTRRQQTYSALGGKGLYGVFPEPFVIERTPQTTDRGEIGQLWVYPSIQASWTLTAYDGGDAIWTPAANAAGVFSSLTVTPGPISLTGTTTINTTGAATTTIATGGTGAVAIGNATGNTTVTGLLTTGALTTVGTVLMNASGAAATTIGTGGTGVVNIGNATGTTVITGVLTVSSNIFATNGVVSAGNTAASTVGASLQTLKSRAGGAILAGDTLGYVIFAGNDGTQYTSGAMIQSTSSGTIASTRIAADLQFFTHPDSAAATPTLRAFILPDGAMTINAPDTGVGLTINGGGQTIGAGNLTLTNGNLVLSTAATKITLPGPVNIMTGAGAPDAGLAVNVGDMYINTTAASAVTRMYIATAASTWTNVTCAA